MAKVLVALVLLGASSLAAVAKENADGLVVRAQARTPDQIAAFYAARGFPQNAIDALTRACFVTVTIVNRRNDVVWLELDNLRFVDAQGRPIPRITRAEWNARWERLSLPAAKRATFGWTQLPESRDLQPGEPVGGNVTIERPRGPFVLEAAFRLANGREPLRVRIPGLVCAASPEHAP